MRMRLRADASDVIGTGHFVRQVALAQHLLREGTEVFLVGNISGPEWLLDYVREQEGLVRVDVPEGDFSGALFEDLGLDALLIDSYRLSNIQLGVLQSIVPTVGVMLDGPWQELTGSIAIAPTLDTKSSWLEEAGRNFDQFYCGPSFILLRDEVLGMDRQFQLAKKKDQHPRIVVSTGGGTNNLGLEILRSLLQRPKPANFDIFFSPSQELLVEILKSPHTVTTHARGSTLLALLSSTDVVVSAAGTSAAELLFLGVPTIFVPTAENQAENAASIERLGLGPVVRPGSTAFEEDLLDALDFTLRSLSASPQTKIPVDARGAMRIAEVMLHQRVEPPGGECG